MGLIPETVIDEIQARSDIAEWIGRYVPLKRAGRHYKALCPFHKERTPSFVVNTDKQIFHCFGCGVGGNVFGFLMQHDRLTFPEAVRQLGEHVGVPMPTQARDVDGRTEQLSALLDKICGYFERRLAHPQHGRSGRAYLSERGVRDATRKAFRLGLAPTGWSGLLRAASASAIEKSLLEEAGLIIKGQAGHYDRFRNRLIFPIQDARGRVVGFGGRSLDGREPKYLNSPETPIYHKGRHLFGLAQAKDAILARKVAVIVEGYFDCIVLADAGLTHVVSPLGTALTEEQVRLLKRYAPQVILAFDADAAGETATLRGIDLLVEAGVEVRVAQLPAGVDPDEYVRARGLEGLERLLGESLDIFECLVAVAAKRFALDRPEGKVRAAQFILPTIARVPSAMLRSEYVHLLAGRLKLDEAAVLEELKKARPRELSTAPAPPQAAQAPKSRGYATERRFVALILEEPARWGQASPLVSLEDITDETLRRVAAAVSESGVEDQASVARIVSRLTEEGLGSFVTDLVEDTQRLPSPEKEFEGCVRRLHEEAEKRQQAKILEQMNVARAAGQDDTEQELTVAFNQRLKGR